MVWKDADHQITWRTNLGPRAFIIWSEQRNRGHPSEPLCTTRIYILNTSKNTIKSVSFSICASNPWLRFNGSWLPHQPTLPAVQQHPQTRNLPPPQRTLFMAPADANPQAVSSFTSSTAPTRPADASSNSTTAGGWRTKPARAAVVSRKSQPSDAAPAAAESPPAHVPHEFTAPSTPGYASGDTAVHRLEKARGNHKKAFLLSLFFIPLPFSHYGQREC